MLLGVKRNICSLRDRDAPLEPLRRLLLSCFSLELYKNPKRDRPAMPSYGVSYGWFIIVDRIIEYMEVGEKTEEMVISG